MPLTDKQALFVQEYLVDLNGTQAAIRAGYSLATARQYAEQLLKLPAVLAEVRARQLAIRAAVQVTQEDVVREIARIAFSDIRNVMQWTASGGVQFHDSAELSDDAARTVAEVTERRKTEITGKDDPPVLMVERKVKLYDKLGALKLLAQHLGMMPEKGTVNVDASQNLTLPSGVTLDELRRLSAELRSLRDG